VFELWERRGQYHDFNITHTKLRRIIKNNTGQISAIERYFGGWKNFFLTLEELFSLHLIMLRIKPKFFSECFGKIALIVKSHSSNFSHFHAFGF